MKQHNRASSSVFEFRESMSRQEAPNKPKMNSIKLGNGMEKRNMVVLNKKEKQDIGELESNYLALVMQRKRKIFESFDQRRKPKEQESTILEDTTFEHLNESVD